MDAAHGTDWEVLGKPWYYLSFYVRHTMGLNAPKFVSNVSTLNNDAAMYF